MGHGLPNLVRGENKDGGHDLGYRVKDEEQRGLRAAALCAVFRVAVKPVLDDIKIEIGHLDNTELVYRVGHADEFIVAIGLLALFDQSVQARDSPSVQRLHLFRRNKAVRVKPVEVAETIARSVAELEIVLAKLFENRIGAAHVRMIVG